MGADRRNEFLPREKRRGYHVGVDGLDDLVLARPEQDVASPARAHLARAVPQAPPPMTPSDRSSWLHPRPRTLSAADRAASVRAPGVERIRQPELEPLGARHAIIAALSVHSQPGGTMNCRPFAPQVMKRGPDGAIGCHSTCNDKRRRSERSSASESVEQGSRPPPVGGRSDVRRSYWADAAPAAPRLKSCEGEMRLARTDQWSRQWNRSRIAVFFRQFFNRVRPDRAAQAASPP